MKLSSGLVVAVAIFCCSSTRCVSAQDLSTSSEGREEKHAEYIATEDIVYGHKDGMALTLDVLEPKVGKKGIGLVLVSSGSWRSAKSDVQADEDRRRNEDHWCQGLLRGGFTLFVARHGSSPRYTVPEMIPDMKRAVRYVRTHASKFQVHPDCIGITSGSSGGHLALMTALTPDDGKEDSLDPIERASCRTQAVVAWFPPTDMVNWGITKGYTMVQLVQPDLFKRMFGEITNLESQLQEISPIYYVTERSPPLLLIHGDADKTVPLQQSRLMHAKYEELKVPVKLLVQPGGGHSSWPGIYGQYPAVWSWFDQHLAKSKTP